MAIDDNKTYGLTGAQVKDLVNGIESKQNTLTPGSNIQISNDTISATDTTYTAGTGLNLTGTQFSIDTSVVAEVSDIPTKTSDLTNDGEDGASTYVEAGDLATVATTGSYNDLSNKPTIGDATITIQKNGTSAGTFTTNATTNKSINIAVPTKTSDLTNDGSDGTSTYVEAGDLATVATSGNYADLTNKPTVDSSLNTSSSNAVTNSAISTALNDNVVTGISVNSTPSTTTVQLDGAKKNLYSGSTTTSSITLPVASTTQAGVMNSSTFDAVAANSNNINALLNGAVAITGLPATPTQAQLTTAWENETGLTSLINRASIYDVTNEKVWTYYVNDATWHAASNSSQVTVSTWTNSSEGVVLGSTNDGQIFAESDGTGSVNGWDTLKNAVTDNTSKLATIAQGAEVNVQANWNETNTSSDAYIQNKPTIPTVNNATLTITQNGTSAGTFTANASSNKTIALTDTTYSDFTGADASTAGTAGLVPAPAAGDNTKYLAGDGTWKTVSQYALPIATANDLGGIKVGSRLTINSSTGVLSADSQTDNNFTTTLKDKLDGIASGAEVNVQANWNETNSSSDAYIQNKPTIPTVNDATLTIQKNGTTVETFTANASSNVTANISVPTKTSDLTNDGSDNTAQYLETDETAYRTTSIPYGVCDNTSTSTVYTATVPGITELRDGVCMWLKNGVVTSESGFTIEINNLGAKPVYSNLSAASRVSTLWSSSYTMFFVYDSTRVSGGCWVMYYGYNANDNTIGYQIRTNSQTMAASDKTYRYRLLFTSADGTKYVPATLSSSTDATTARTPNQRPINPFGRIFYYSSTTAINAGSRFGTSSLWEQNNVVLGYSFAQGSELSLASYNPVYLKCAPQSDGSAVIDSTTPYVQTLPSTEDGKIYIFLGIASDATHVELQLDHPIYHYKDGMIRPYTNATSYSNFVGSDGTNAGAAGLVPAPTASDNTKFLKGDGTWATVSSGQSYTAGTGIDITSNVISIDTAVVAELNDLPSDFTGATSSVAGAHGLVPAPTTSDVDKYLKGDGTWGSVAAPLDVFTTNEWNALWA